MMKKPIETPWYRYAAPWLLIAPVAATVIASFVTLGLAIRSEDGLVTEDYYTRGEAIAVDLQRDKRAEQLGIHALLFVGNNSIRLQLFGAVTPSSLNLQLIHPTRSGADQRIELLHRGGNIYEAPLSQALAPQQWLLIIDDASQRWRLTEKVALGSGHNALLAPLGSKHNPVLLD